MKPDTKKQAAVRLRRIEGQVAAVRRMVEEDRYCVDVLLQIAAAQAALDRVGKVVLEGHVETCVTEALRSGSVRERRTKTRELMEVFTRFGHIRAR